MSLTGANAIIMLGVAGVFDTPQQLQGFAADDVFASEMIRRVEVLMGVDGFLSGGFVNVEVKQTISLQSDSPTQYIFDDWDAAQVAASDTFEANGLVLLTTLGAKWTLRKGFLTGYTPIPDVKKLVQPRKFEITWQQMRKNPV